MDSALTLRLTYGIGGNVPEVPGPLPTVRDAGLNPFLKSGKYRIHPTRRCVGKNHDQLWGRFSVLNNRLFSSLDLL